MMTYLFNKDDSKNNDSDDDDSNSKKAYHSDRACYSLEKVLSSPKSQATPRRCHHYLSYRDGRTEAKEPAQGQQVEQRGAAPWAFSSGRFVAPSAGKASGVDSTPL